MRQERIGSLITRAGASNGQRAWLVAQELQWVCHAWHIQEAESAIGPTCPLCNQVLYHLVSEGDVVHEGLAPEWAIAPLGGCQPWPDMLKEVSASKSTRTLNILTCVLNFFNF